MASLLKANSRFLYPALAALLLAGPVCSQEIVRHSISLPAQETRVVSIQQRGEDLKVTVESPDGSSFTVDHPLGRTGPEIFLLGPYQTDTEMVIEVSGASDPGGYSLISSDAGNDGSLIRSAQLLTQAGMMAAAPGKKNSAALLELYREAQSVAEDGPFGLSQYAAYLQATLLFRQANYPAALDALESADSDTIYGPFSYKPELLKAEVLFAKDRYAESRQVFESLLIRMAALDVSTDELALDLAGLRSTLGFAQLLTGERQAGKANLDQALDLATQYKDAETLGHVHNNLGGYYFMMNNADDSAEHFNLAIDNLRIAGDQQELIYTLSNQSLFYTYIGKYQLARETAQLALELAEENSNPSQLSAAYNSITELYLKLGEYQVAGKFAALAEDFERNSGREWRVIIMNNLQADALLGEKKLAAAVAKYQFALQYFQKNGPESRVFGTYERLINAYVALGDLPQAETELTAARALSDDTGDALLELEARLFLAKGDARSAIDLLSRLPLPEGDERIKPQHVELARLLMRAWQHENLEQSVYYGDQAITYIDRIRTQLDFARLGPAWSEQTYPVYLEQVDNLMRMYDTSGDQVYARQAYEVSEQGLAFNLHLQRSAQKAGEQRETEHSADLRNQLAALARDRASGADDATDVQINYFRVLEQYQASLDKAEVDQGFAVTDISAVQAQLPNNRLLIEYVCVPGSNCYEFSVSSDGFEARTLGSFNEIEILASAVQTEVTDIGRNSRPASLMLGNRLFGGGSHKPEHLSIVANYPLNTIPLSALQTGQSQQSATALVQDHKLSLLPSVSSYFLESRAQSRQFQYDLAVLADPVFTQNDATAIPAMAQRGGDSRRGWYEGLSRLPWSAREASSLESIYAEDKVRVMVGADASKTNLLDNATRNSRILHIASHGYFNASTPDLVGIATTPEPGDTGFVSLEELMMYPFNAELVVISGCETGLGDSRGGEGMISLARGFLGQGATHVIATLWPVSDRASAKFMELFYQALHDQQVPVAEALQLAQLGLSAQPEYSSPYYWAPYVLTSLGE